MIDVLRSHLVVDVETLHTIAFGGIKAMRQSLQSACTFSSRAMVRTSLLTAVLVGLGAQACTRKSKLDVQDPTTTHIENKQERPGVTIPSGNLPRPSGSGGGDISWLGGIVSTRVIAGQVFIPVQGTFSDASFASVMESASAQGLNEAERNSLIRSEVEGAVKAIARSMKVLQPEIISEVGFFTAFIPLASYDRLRDVTGLSRRILVNPVLSMARDPESLNLRSANGISLGLHADSALDGRGDTSSYSGLARIGVADFLAKVKTEISEDADGSNTLVGVTDTGVTLNHPAFFDANGANRIQYLKDFTGEGQIYFSSNAAFSAREPDPSEVPAGANAAELVVISAQYLMPPVGTRAPAADMLSDLQNQVFQVSAEIKAALLTPNSGARMGVFSEASLGNPDGSEVVDLNHNGAIDDVLWAILLPDADTTKSKMYLDITGRGDFRKSQAVSNWNTSKSTVKVYSETPGFEIKPIKLMDSVGNDVDAVAAAIVGYDPGNHGSHVSGIIAGRKTLANDAADTNARGVAPNAKLMVNRVCANNGGCGATGAIIDLALNGAEVINMSLGGLGPLNDGYGVQETIINRLTLLRNTLFVISAGNSGPGHQTVGSPSVARMALSVAATASRKMIERQYQWPGSGKNRFSAAPTSDDEDFVLFFSSRGPTAAGGLKPNVSAPGTELSSVQLNTAPGARPGLDVYWGTSMAAPTATGAVALLIDAAKRYNAQNPSKVLPLDARVLHKVLSASARPFDANTFDGKTQTRSLGQYTWIDQGNGMINLLAAWDALKAERDSRIPSAVAIDLGNGQKQEVALDYEVRVLRSSPNGLDYSGAVDAPTDAAGGIEPRFGRGIYLDINGTDSLIEVQIARRLPFSVLRRADIGDLARQLNTTGDTFEIETTMHGSAVEWLKAASLESLDCAGAASSHLTVIGPGPVDNFDAPGAGRSVGIRASNLQVCVDRSAINALSAGDHGALIKAYRIADGKREAHPSFVVPVYLAVPHATLAGQAGYLMADTAKSFSVSRNYIQVPEGTSMVKVSIEVPAARVSGTVVSGCAGVELMVLEGENTSIPAELKPRAKARASNCDRNGPTPSKRIVTYSRMNPKAGLWDIHVFGQYQFKESPYKLTVEFAKVTTSLAAVAGKPAVLNGSLDFEVAEASMSVTPDASKSKFSLGSLVQEVAAPIAQDQELRVPDLDGAVGRTYDATIATVNFSTGGMPGSDIDLAVLECDDAALTLCAVAGQSAGASDVETIDVSPVAGRFYVPIVVGYAVQGPSFVLTETRKLAAQENGTLVVTPISGSKFKVDFAFDVAASQLLQSPLFTGGKWSAGGDLTIKGQDGASLVRIPVKVSAN